MSEPITLTIEEFKGIIRSLMQMFVAAQVEAMTAQSVLLDRGLVDQGRLSVIRAALLKGFEPSIRQFDQLPDEDLLEFLRKFEGPLQ